MSTARDEFLSEEDLDLRNLTHEELIAWWNLWLEQAQASNELDEDLYSHGVFEREPPGTRRPAPAAPAANDGGREQSPPGRVPGDAGR